MWLYPLSAVLSGGHEEVLQRGRAEVLEVDSELVVAVEANR